LAEKTTVFSSKTEVRRLIKEGGLFINKNKITEDLVITIDFLINNQYMLIQRGKKNYYVIIAQ